MSKKIVSVEKLPKSVIIDCSAASKKLEVIENKIEKRISYIINKISELCKIHSTGWAVFNDSALLGALLGDAYVGWFSQALSTDIMILDFGFEESVELVLNDGEVWSSIDQVMPVRWLYEDFEREVIDGLAIIKKRNQDETKLDLDITDIVKINKIASDKRTTPAKKKQLIKALLK